MLGTLAGIAMARQPGKWTYWFIGLLLLVSVTPEIVDAVSLLPWLVFLGQDLGMSVFNDGTVRLVVGHSLFSVAVVTYIVRARLVGLPANLEEASARPVRAAGARRSAESPCRWRCPRSSPGSCCRSRSASTTRSSSAFVQVSGSTPWPVYVLSALRSGLRPEIAAVSTVMLLADAVALAARRARCCKRAGDSATDIARTMAGG